MDQNLHYINTNSKNEEKIYNNNNSNHDKDDRDEHIIDINEHNNGINGYNNNLNDKIINNKFKLFIVTIFFITILICLINYIIRKKCFSQSKRFNQAVEEVTNTNRSTNDENNKMHDKEKSKTLEIIEIGKK